MQDGNTSRQIKGSAMVMSPLTLKLDTVHFTDEQFYQLCQNNQDLQFERTPQGELVIMPPVGGESGNREADFIADLVIWKLTWAMCLALQLFSSCRMEVAVRQMRLGCKKNAGKHSLLNSAASFHPLPLIL